MADEERLVRLEDAFATLAELERSLAKLANKHHERISTLEQSFQMLVQLAQSADERMGQQLTWINQLGEAQANTEAKMAALTNAQIKMDEALSSLAESQKHSDQRLDALIDIVREWRNGKS